MSLQQCPCGSGKNYANCCGALHSGERTAATAEALMRSRYSAFVLGNEQYLVSTWHVSTRPPELDLSVEDSQWQRLEIFATRAGGEQDVEGEVEFVAYHSGGQMHERSRFVNEQGQWYYLDGEILPPVAAAKVGRNDPCPCGSGRKYKKCCG